MAILNNEYLLPPNAAGNPYPTAEDLEKAKRTGYIYNPNIQINPKLNRTPDYAAPQNSGYIYDSGIKVNPNINRTPDYAAPQNSGYIYDSGIKVNPNINRTPDYAAPQSSGYVYDPNITINPNINRTPDYGAGQSANQNQLIYGNLTGGLTGKNPFSPQVNVEGLNKPINGPGGIQNDYTLPDDYTSPTSDADPVAAMMGQGGGSVADQYRAAAAAAAEAQRLKTQQAVDRLNYQREQAAQARTDANRESDLTFQRAINPTGKLNQNMRSAGLGGSGWQETSQAGLTNAWQGALNKNTSDYNTAAKEIGIAISEAQQNGDIAMMEQLQNYATQLAQQYYQQSRDAVADQQWQKSYELQVAAFQLEQAAANKTTSSGGTSYVSGGSSGGSGTKTTKAAATLDGLFDDEGRPLTSLTPDELNWYFLNHPITDENGNPVDYETYGDYANSDAFKVDSSWNDDIPAGVKFEIDASIGNRGGVGNGYLGNALNDSEKQQVVASYVAANMQNYGSNQATQEAVAAKLLAEYGMTLDQMYQIMGL